MQIPYNKRIHIRFGQRTVVSGSDWRHLKILNPMPKSLSHISIRSGPGVACLIVRSRSVSVFKQMGDRYRWANSWVLSSFRGNQMSILYIKVAKSKDSFTIHSRFDNKINVCLELRFRWIIRFSSLKHVLLSISMVNSRRFSKYLTQESLCLNFEHEALFPKAESFFCIHYYKTIF